ncbi:MAG: DUF2339 domain-containing protein [Bacteroidota bacterium]|nr:DUF2339 domain-containing protein [Bacteroidota bacterium]
MESIFIVIALAIIFFIIKSSLSADIQSLHFKIELLTKELRQYTKGEVAAHGKQTEKKPQEKPFLQTESAPDYHIKTEPEKPASVEEIKKEEVVPQQPVVESKPVTEVKPLAAMYSKPTSQIPKPLPKPASPGFFERNPDIEKFIGENLANKIGIAILVLGIGYFVKYAIDQEWINEIGRVFIGIICGGILIAIAHKLRKSFTAFSSVLVGGGIAILYFTIAIAFQEYGLLNQMASFFIMVLITCFAVVLSIGYNRQELAVLAIIGGLASPFMLTTGEGNYIVLFSYVLLLNLGMLILAYFKKWNIVNLVCYGFTILIFAGWLGTKYDGSIISMTWGAMLFATLFYIVFFLMNIVNNIKEKSSFKSIEISILLSNTFLYYTAGMIILNTTYGDDFKGLFTALMGIFNFIFAFILYRSQRVDKNLVFLLIGLVLTFISLAAPIQLQGNFITLFWAAEAVLLLWLAQKSGIVLMKYASVVIMILMGISLMMDWRIIYLHPYIVGKLPIILNKAYITGVFAIASIAITTYLLKNEKEGSFLALIPGYKIILPLAGIVVLYISNLLELKHHLDFQVNHFSTQAIITGSYNMLFIVGIIFLGKKLPLPDNLKNGFAFWGILAIASYLIYYHGLIVSVRDSYLIGITNGLGYYFHYLLVALLLLISIKSLSIFKKLSNFNRVTSNAYWWFFTFFFIFLVTAELDHHVLMASFYEGASIKSIISQNSKIGYPILWGLSSFALIALGLKHKIKDLRIISLFLFLITLIKLFVFDIRGVSEGGKIAAFISLGVLLLIVSFMYQKLKLLLIDDVPVANTETQG